MITGLLNILVNVAMNDCLERAHTLYKFNNMA